MINYLTAERLAKSYSEHPLFTDIWLSLQENQKAALIAANGTGKSTILKICAQKEQPDEGKVIVRSDIVVGYLPQEPEMALHLSVKENIFISDHKVLQLIGEYERLLNLTPYEKTSDFDKQLEEVIAQIDNNKAWDYEAKVASILGKLNIHNLEQKVESLSGGQRKRLALARLLIEEPDLMLLDEPTNHLDLDMIEWLEQYLTRLNNTVLLITHDRYFLDNVCDTIYELDNGKMYQYKGNYSYFLEKKHERETVQAAELGKAQNLYKRELDWMRRQPKARTTKQKARIDSFYETEEKAKSGKVEQKASMTMQMQRMGSKIMEFENICKSYGDHILFDNFSYTFKRGEKIGIVGRNGTGKSTLLKMIMGEVAPDRGRIKKGDTISFAYYSQDGLQLKEDMRVLEYLRTFAEYVDTGNGGYINVSQFLNHFKFDYSKQHSYVSKLSGGEKRRLYLLSLLIQNPNFLILDEPTNDLDIVTLNLLEEFIEGYEGCMLLVTHDRYFMDRTVDHVFVMNGDGKVSDIHGNYTAYRLSLNEITAPKPASIEKKKNDTPQDTKPKTRKGLSFKEKREYETLEKEIASLEARKAELIAKVSTPDLAHSEIMLASNELALLESYMDEKTMRWLELSELENS
ncbi:MAG: ABC-F family ATP-binding cassette domain-containing protein [Bacteroidetes bacterium]|nr:ABC-F family ATP-binding cassette domain-containing protein [Bacteroidota bacterium]